jgi:hypothetical protein
MPSSSFSAAATPPTDASPPAEASPPADASSEETPSTLVAEELRAGDTVNFGVSRMSSVRVQDMQRLGYFGGGVARVPGTEEVPEPEGELVVCWSEGKDATLRSRPAATTSHGAASFSPKAHV